MHIELVIAKVVTVGLGLLISYQAYKGYRIHGNQPMLYVAIGFLLISVGSVIEGILFDVVGLSIFQAGVIQTTLVACGMLVILYSLYGSIDTGADKNEI
ncbi:hypothetical protein VB773_17760 [Haloarculaceae archaeon H-GB2-1]|nr:hypothetical protein [Haloarculaceae archaeon H-GB1-1]MEA5387742.1 hypothetical protein [Haloarculaceae archaeon H-GB11]MEA5409234.1 hypothetical protein [Haloarculaceae archaeon H-GB2-1]